VISWFQIFAFKINLSRYSSAASETKWKQLGELAMSAGDIELASACLVGLHTTAFHHVILQSNTD
jgi:hypothetical protein